jgi:hypothetical protein
MIAQGIALGELKGRNNLAPMTIVAPFQGWVAGCHRGPRALPWAGLYQPFRLKEPQGAASGFLVPAFQNDAQYVWHGSYFGSIPKPDAGVPP